MGRKIVFLVSKIVMAVFFRVRIEGSEHLPDSGPGIIAINHIGRLDVFLVIAALKRDDISGWVAEKYQKVPGMKWLVGLIDGIWIDRFNVDLRAMRQAQNYLKAGGLLGIAPEGTRSPERSLIKGKQGLAYLAATTGAPVIPAGVAIPKNCGYRALCLMRPKVSLVIGDPFTLPPLERATREQALEKGTEEIMCRIAALIPENYRGVYRQNPRLAELLSMKV